MPEHIDTAVKLGLGLKPGADHYRAYIGPPGDYDLVAAMTFGLLVSLGCRQQHKVLDVGCGSLRVGRLLIPYLNSQGYTGIEPNEWLVRDGIAREVGADQVGIKEPRFHYADNAHELIGEACRYDYVVAQSIFSHCGADLLEMWVAEFSSLLSSGGTAVVTYLEDTKDSDESGWIYPGCVKFTRRTLEDIARRHGLAFVSLDWRHPRQQWALLATPGFESARFVGSTPGWNQGFDWYVSRQQSARVRVE